MARDEDDDRPLNHRSSAIQVAGPKDLSPFSIAELKNYISMLHAEIGRIEDTIVAKEKHRGGAEGLFRR